ncbi:MAG TPA: mechanosensitive ion channel family protein [Kofleriaceae bacterium]|nr:mechanosensitive ion channel family protein [Kofleriaceae bacterium]
MHFWSTLGEQLWTARTPFLVLAYVVTRALAARLPRPLERYHLRAVATLLFGHLVALSIAAGQDAYGYESHITEHTSFAFEAIAVVTLGVTAMFRVLLPRLGFTLPRIMIDLVTAVGIIVVFIAIGKRAGFSVAGLITTSAVLTAVIGFSLQDTLGNVMGGLSVQLDKSIAVGDWVSLAPGQPVGRVTEIRWRYTAIETRNWDTMIIPNGMLVKSAITILGRRAGQPPQTRRLIDFFVDFRSAPTEVIEAVEAALRKDTIPGAASEPAPNVLFMGIRDSYAHYQARYWLVDLERDDGTDSRVRVRIYFGLRRAGIALAIPASAMFVTQETPERETRKADRELDQRLRALAKVDLFSGLSPELQRSLADQLVLQPFAGGEAVTREGEKDDGLFMIVEGDAIVRIGAGASEREVARLGAGQFFGEMSLMTGEARTATVIAATDLVCYRMNKHAFETVLRETPAIADQVAEVLAMRRSALTAARDERDSDRRKRMETAKHDLLGRIRGFFGLDAPR